MGPQLSQVLFSEYPPWPLRHLLTAFLALKENNFYFSFALCLFRYYSEMCNIFPSIVEFYCYCNFVEIYFMPQNAVYPSICPMDIYRIYFCCHRIECFLNVSEILLADDVEFSHVLAGSMSCYSIHY